MLGMLIVLLYWAWERGDPLGQALFTVALIVTVVLWMRRGRR